MALTITSIAAFLNGLFILALTIKVILIRRRDGVVLGDNDDRVLTKAIRGQANATEQIPLALILMGLIEVQNGPGWLLIPLAATFTIGRLMHATYFGIHGTPWQLRFYGMFLTLIAQGGLILALLLTLISQ
ncbi:MAPEG family protein [Yoonia sp. 2307UL14-13]|uniref:MAPEG family protein n=1 Tax=Yoonia sp. 2307UL14-13 TaxID=3126506 RepID=UPI0030A35C12